MTINSKTFPLNFIGNKFSQGTYVNHIRVSDYIKMPFGRFKGGKSVGVLPGDYTYVGSAMALQGATCLAHRLVRHATRTGSRRPHHIRAEMLREFPRVGLAPTNLKAPSVKTLRWNVDHLLDKPSAELVSAYIIRSTQRLEPEIGQMLEADAATVVFESGLGANDIPGATHLLRVDADDDWWNELPVRLDSLRVRAEEMTI